MPFISCAASSRGPWPILLPRYCVCSPSGWSPLPNRIGRPLPWCTTLFMLSVSVGQRHAIPETATSCFAGHPLRHNAKEILQVDGHLERERLRAPDRSGNKRCAMGDRPGWCLPVGPARPLTRRRAAAAVDSFQISTSTSTSTYAPSSSLCSRTMAGHLFRPISDRFDAGHADPRRPDHKRLADYRVASMPPCAPLSPLPSPLSPACGRPFPQIPATRARMSPSSLVPYGF